MPDWWAFHYFGPNTNALADSDNDGYANWMEYLAGTSPIDPVSRLAFGVQAAGAGALQPFFSPWQPGRTYRLQQRLNPAGWLTLTDLIPFPDAQGRGAFTITNITLEPAGVYRLQMDWER